MLAGAAVRHPHHSFRVAGVVVFTAIMASAASSARAADPETERARALFEEAGELERHGQWTAAQERLRAALRLRETPQLYYALAWALENDDKLLEAKAEYETAARLGREKGPTGEEAARLASVRLAELDKKMPIVKVRVVGGAKSNARVFIDGREYKRDDDGNSNNIVTTPVNPGSHVVRIERGSSDGSVETMVYVGRSTVRTVDVDAGELVALRDSTQDRHGRTAALVTTTSQRPATNNGGPGVLPWLLVSGGVAFIAGGAALLFSADSDADTRDALQAKWCGATACSGGTTATRPETAEAASYRREASEAADTGNTKQAVGVALGGVGVVSAVAGAILLLRSGNKGAESGGAVVKKDPHHSRSSRGQVSSMSAAPIPGGAFANVGFSF